MMGVKFLAVFLCLAVVRLSEGAAPVITGGNTQEHYLSPSTAAGGTVFTLTSDQAALYVLSGTDASLFTAAPTTGGSAGTTGTITVNAAAVCATKSSYSFTVDVSNSASPVETTSVAVTVKVCGCSSGSSTITGSLTAILCLAYMLFKKVS